MINQSQQLEFFKELMSKKYKAAAFDVDGTLTEIAEHGIPDFISEALVKLALQFPIAICTGRRLEHAVTKIDALYKAGLDIEFIKSRIYMLCENGSIGYFYDLKRAEYIEFYRIQYPYSRAHMENMFEDVRNKLGYKMDSSFCNETSMVFQAENVNDPDKVALNARSYELAKEIQKIAAEHDTENLLRVATAGIGVIIFPKFGDKKDAVFKWAELLKDRGYTFGIELREIFMVGDMPGELGNDKTFLDGSYGTAFTVGDLVKNSKWPVPVFDLANEQRMIGPRGTFRLLEQLGLL